MAVGSQVPLDKVEASAPRLFSFGSWICKNGRVGKTVKHRVGEPVRELVKWLMLWFPEALQQLTAFSDIKIKTGYSIFMVRE